RRVRRQRAIAGASLAAFAIAVGAVLSLRGGEAGGGPTAAGPSAAGPTAGTHTPAADAGRLDSGNSSGSAAGKVRNAIPGADWRPFTGPVPILEYHVLGPAPADAPYPELYVSRPDFHRQMNWLDEHGYQAVTLDQVEKAWYGDGTLPAKPAVVSFDDGYRSQFTYALPELRKHGWAGVLNLKAEGSDLYPSNIEAMLAAGWELAAHTTHHLDLTELDTAHLKEEVAGSRAILRREYGVPVNNFCYPAGRFDKTVIDAVRAAGYTGATTEIPGYANRTHPFELSRFEILGSTAVAGMAADLR
ncbi:MAG TPA: polysaccharide deacetylase family protein, partial [Solirubrobacterales bacterium]|nr:polysaccharide deacetylase family protein [Solirubrobacterales bacterium]